MQYLFVIFYSSDPNKRAFTPYLILTKLPPCTLFVKYSRLICNFFGQKLGLFLVSFVYLAHWWQASVIMNKTASFHPAFFLVFWAKFLPGHLFRTAHLFNVCQDSTLHAYSGLHAYLGNYSDVSNKRTVFNNRTGWHTFQKE